MAALTIGLGSYITKHSKGKIAIIHRYACYHSDVQAPNYLRYKWLALCLGVKLVTLSSEGPPTRCQLLVNKLQLCYVGSNQQPPLNYLKT